MKHEEENIIETLEQPLESRSNIVPGEIIIGTLVELDKQGQPWVNFPENPTGETFLALTTQGLSENQVGRQVALLFANGNIETPVIMGIIHSPLQDMLENFEQTQLADDKVELESNLKVDDVLIDGKKITFAAREQIVLKCGESSITLTKAGKILIRGKYLLNRSTGVNRIMGGSVQVN